MISSQIDENQFPANSEFIMKILPGSHTGMTLDLVVLYTLTLRETESVRRR